MKISSVVGRTFLRCLGVAVGEGCRVYGIPTVSMVEGSRISLGSEVMMISINCATALGVNHPVVLRTMASNAVITIGARSGISGGSFCAAREIEIGENCLIGANVTIADFDFHPISPRDRHNSLKAIEAALHVCVGNNVFIGTGATILKGVSIGDNSVIGANSVVTTNIPANVIAAGNPTRVIRDICG